MSRGRWRPCTSVSGAALPFLASLAPPTKRPPAFARNCITGSFRAAVAFRVRQCAKASVNRVGRWFGTLGLGGLDLARVAKVHASSEPELPGSVLQLGLPPPIGLLKLQAARSEPNRWGRWAELRRHLS